MDFDLIVIGSGPGGYVAAIRASQLGLKTAVVEKDNVGGLCLNWGCIPTKSLLKNAEVLNVVKGASEFGLSFENLRYDFGKAISRSRTVVRRLTAGIKHLLSKNGIEYITGTAYIEDSQTVQIYHPTKNQTTKLKTSHIILATGARPKDIPNLTVDGESIITSREALDLKIVPASLLIVGGGATGVEFAHIYSSYGSDVTLVERMGSLLPNEDRDISNLLEKSFVRQGIKVLTEHSILKTTKENENLNVTLQGPLGQGKYSFEKILLATGVEGNTKHIGLEDLGIEISNGFIEVDEKMRTSRSNVYAIGDVTGKLLLAHVASAQAMVAVDSILGIETMPIKYRDMPKATYCHPQITSFGYTESEATKLDLPVKIGSFPFQANGKALATGDTYGLVKLIINENTGEILGAHMIGQEVTELLPELILTKTLSGTVDDIIGTVHSHPTLSEAIREASLGARGRDIHI